MISGRYERLRVSTSYRMMRDNKILLPLVEPTLVGVFSPSGSDPEALEESLVLGRDFSLREEIGEERGPSDKGVDGTDRSAFLMPNQPVRVSGRGGLYSAATW